VFGIPCGAFEEALGFRKPRLVVSACIDSHSLVCTGTVFYLRPDNMCGVVLENLCVLYCSSSIYCNS
jgi:hypothetical protein